MADRLPGPQVFLNEEVTAELHAETGMWLPQLEPDQERWLTVTLLVDSGDLMRLWSHTAQRLAETLHCSGAFRDVRTVRWQEDGFGGEVAGGIDGRHLVLVLTDLHADHWGDGRARRRLARWGRAMPVAIVHVLPEHVWARAGTQTSSLLLTSPRPASPNRSGLLRRTEAEPGESAGPGVELEFGDGVRRELLSDGTRGETARALMLALDHLAVAYRRMGKASLFCVSRIARGVSPRRVYGHGFRLFCPLSQPWRDRTPRPPGSLRRASTNLHLRWPQPRENPVSQAVGPSPPPRQTPSSAAIGRDCRDRRTYVDRPARPS
ncbi:hypothetical protein [Streptomyces sp. NBC_00145]|uniref:hypothetical protein n=1 Tax=Streptomyces sp. NBC_00145 TaxID=2975666 RepID=UPI002E185BE2